MAEPSDNRRMVPARVPRAPTTIGALPDEILLRVMSHLTTRQAVHTCVLSQYWRDLWRSVPCINVSIEEFEGKDDFERINTSMEEFEGQDDDDDGFEPMDVSIEEFEGEDDDDDFEPMSVSIEEFGRQNDIEREVVFKRFVNRLLMLRNPVGLDEFRLRYSYRSDNGSDSQDANNWISYAS